MKVVNIGAALEHLFILIGHSVNFDLPDGRLTHALKISQAMNFMRISHFQCNIESCFILTFFRLRSYPIPL